MKINNCRAARAQMLPFLGGELTPELGQQMSEHLISCAACAAYAAQIEAMTETIDRALGGDEMAPVTLDARVMATIRRSPARGLAWPKFDAPWARARRFQLALGVASALLVGFVGGQLWRAPRTPIVAGASLGAASLGAASLGAAMPPDELVAAYRKMENGLMTRGTREAQIAAQLRAIAPAGADADIELIALKNSDARLVGGCWMNVGGHFVPSFCYQWKGRRVSIFQAPSGAKDTGNALGAARRSLDGFVEAGRPGVRAGHNIGARQIVGTGAAS